MTTEPRTARIEAFCERLQALGAGERARLKRCAGRSLAESPEALGLFYRLLPPGTPEREEETYFLVATLYPLASAADAGSLGGSLARARNAQNERGLDRRVEALLDSDEAQLPVRLRRAIHFVHSQGVGVDWPHLLGDLLQWTHPDRFVQQEWARAYFAPRDVTEPAQ